MPKISISLDISLSIWSKQSKNLLIYQIKILLNPNSNEKKIHKDIKFEDKAWWWTCLHNLIDRRAENTLQETYKNPHRSMDC